MSETPNEEEAAKWQRRLGAAANNRGWKLSEMPVRTAAEDDEMLHAAHASRHLWSTVGNDENFALGDLLLGQVHALLGHGRLALRYAEAAFAFFSSRASEAWETAFSHLVLSHAAHAAGKLDAHSAYYVRPWEQRTR